jgi:hypothetical protein
MTDSEKKDGIKGIPIINLMISGRDSLASNLKPKVSRGFKLKLINRHREKANKTNMI